MEIITPAVYYLKNDRHYVLYDEVVEGVPGTVKNTIKINGDSLFELRKSGLANARMVFEKGKDEYDFLPDALWRNDGGDPHEGHHHRSRRGQEIDVHISYALDINSEPLSDCEIDVHIRPVHSAEAPEMSGILKS